MTVAEDGPRSNVILLMGTRPEAIKMFPVVLALRDSTWFAPIGVTTESHRIHLGAGREAREGSAESAQDHVRRGRRA